MSELLKKGVIEAVELDKKIVKEFMELSRTDLLAAEDNLKTKHFGWALAISYNSMLYAGRALMAARGYRATSDAHHLGVVQFCAAILPQESSQLVVTFNRYRIRRHDVVYGEAEQVKEEEAKRAIENAKIFVKKIEEKIIYANATL